MKNHLKINQKHKNQVRIIGGQCRGRQIHFPDVEGLRPTPDYVRERLFNWLGQDLTGQVVLDLFAGSGALGFEAASRYAKQVLMCEINHEAAKSLRQAAQNLSLNSCVQVWQQDGVQFLKQTSQVFDLILLDPPFVWQNWERLWAILNEKLADDGYIYIEAGDLPVLPDWLVVCKEGRAGKSRQQLLSR